MQEQHEVAAGPGTGEGAGAPVAVRNGEPLYTRPMPGGGYVRVELLVSDRGDVGGELRRGRVVIEPREGAPRRADDAPLVVEELEGDDEGAMVAELFRIARDNAAIARRVLRRRSAIQRAD